MSDDDIPSIPPGLPEDPSQATGAAKNWRDRVGEFTQSRIIQPLQQTFAPSLQLARDPSRLLVLGSQAIKNRGLGFYGSGITALVSAYFLADVAAIGLSRFIPQPPPSRTRPGSFSGVPREPFEDYAGIVSRNLFNSKGLLPGEGEGPSDQGNAPVRTALPLNLIGTLILKDELKSIATIEDKAAAQVYPVRALDEIPDKLKIISIEARRVIFLNVGNGRREFVEMPAEPESMPKINVTPNKTPGAGIERTSANQFSVQRTEIDKALSNLNQVLTQARAVPHYENGQPVGWKLYQIVPGSIYDKLGLQNGDLLCGINGQGISDAGKALEMLGELKSAKSIDLCIKRDGRQNNYAYEIN